MVTDLQGLSAGVLLEHLCQAVSEKALLSYDDAPDAELRNVQKKIDDLQFEALRRMSW